MVETPQDSRTPYSEGPVPAELRIHGTHSIGVSVRDMEFMAEFMQVAWGSRLEAEDTGLQRYAMGEGGTGAYIDFEIEPDRKPGSWIVGNGAVHHMAFNVASLEQQAEIKFFVEGLGYTDFSDVKDRGYFDSIYVRTPSGALFEACVSHPDAFTSDEPLESLGTGVMVAPQLEGSKEELLDVIGRVSD
jgi:glyoxalase family protein